MPDPCGNSEMQPLTVREMWDIWRTLPQLQLTLFVLPTIERFMVRAKEEHEFYAYEFFRYWKQLVTAKVEV